nr:immunoglobulin light chain junction region [Macaca mulatta]MOV76434.1 immunoglobulin light chain junction region [Macaca mulatta]MOV76880.1 immunoglobulin light chain junction region [Macaca mulatta]
CLQYNSKPMYSF